MTADDLMHGDRPWRVRVDTRRWADQSLVERAVIVVSFAAWVAASFVLPDVLVLLSFAAWVAVSYQPIVSLEGGGRRPMSSSEIVAWQAHHTLESDEADRRG